MATPSFLSEIAWRGLLHQRTGAFMIRMTILQPMGDHQPRLVLANRLHHFSAAVLRILQVHVAQVKIFPHVETHRL
jgi:hypothetical protein